MRLNGQGIHIPEPKARAARPWLMKPLKKQPFVRSLKKESIGPGPLIAAHPPLPTRRFGDTFGPATLKGESAGLLGLVILLHAAALYALTSVTDIKMPAVSVPLQISFVSSEPVQEKPKIKPKPEPQALADEPIPIEKPPEESQPQVIPPEYKVAHLNNPVPVYPPQSRRLREQGDVILRVYVSPEGLPGQIQLHTSSGYPRLDRAAQEAVGRWKFMPARRGEDAVGAWVLVTINYVLS